MVGGETLLITLTTGILGYGSQNKREFLYIFRTIEVSSGEIRTCILLVYFFPLLLQIKPFRGTLF